MNERCRTCAHGRNCINGRWCEKLRKYVQYDKNRYVKMEIKVNKKGKIILKAEDGEYIRIKPKHLPTFRNVYEISCDEFEVEIETIKNIKK